MFTQQLMNALAIGSVYALTAMGATLIYGILGILDIANAGAYLIGAYLGWYIYYATGSIVLAFVLSMLAVGVLGILIQKFIYSPILAKPNTLSIIPLVAAVGLFTMSSDLVRLMSCRTGSGMDTYLRAHCSPSPHIVVHSQQDEARAGMARYCK